ncbi:MAG: nuclear transport factor 2 family protein [Bacteroidales bacterium]|nr:nuclear transport factor 2 family protein [Bacteroidales bacterium]
MKRIALLFTGFLLVFSMGCRQEAKKRFDTAKEKEAVKNVLEKYVIANENKDFNMFKQIWAPDSDIIMYGTDSNEKLIGWNSIQKAIKQQFANVSQTYISVINQDIKLNRTGNTAWFAEELNYNFVHDNKAQTFDGVRFTGVLEKRPNGWEIVQGHLSIPADTKLAQPK